MRTKLRQRLFSSATIDRCLESLSAATGNVLDTADGLLERTAIRAAHGEQGDGAALERAVARLARKNQDRRTVIQRLLAKGFRCPDIIRHLDAEPTRSRDSGCGSG